jgi:hypothetical protein
VDIRFQFGFTQDVRTEALHVLPDATGIQKDVNGTVSLARSSSIDPPFPIDSFSFSLSLSANPNQHRSKCGALFDKPVTSFDRVRIRIGFIGQKNTNFKKN